MIYTVMSRMQAEYVMIPQEHAVVSINNTGETAARLPANPKRVLTVALHFRDIDPTVSLKEGEYRQDPWSGEQITQAMMFTDAFRESQADDVLDLYEKCKVLNLPRMMVHCGGGVSRSAGTVAGLLYIEQYENQTDIDVLISLTTQESELYATKHPNTHVKSTIIKRYIARKAVTNALGR